jgi:hypothetical protein
MIVLSFLCITEVFMIAQRLLIYCLCRSVFWSWLRVGRWPNLVRNCRLIKIVSLRLTLIVSIFVTVTQLDVALQIV